MFLTFLLNLPCNFKLSPFGLARMRDQLSKGGGGQVNFRSGQFFARGNFFFFTFMLFVGNCPDFISFSISWVASAVSETFFLQKKLSLKC